MADFLMKRADSATRGLDEWFGQAKAKRPPAHAATPAPKNGDGGTDGPAAPPMAEVMGAVGHWAGGGGTELASVPPKDGSGGGDGAFAEARTVEDVDAQASAQKQETTQKIDAEAADVGAKAETEKQSEKQQLHADAEGQKAALPAQAAPTDAPAAAPQTGPASQDEMLAQLDATQEKEEAELDEDKAKGLADIDEKIATQKQTLDGAVLQDSALAGTESDLGAASDKQKQAVQGQLDTDTAANTAKTTEDRKAAQERANKEADALEKRGETEAQQIEQKGVTDGVATQAQYITKASGVLSKASAAAQQVRDDGKPDEQADKIMSEASATYGSMMSDGVTQMQKIIAAAKDAADKHRGEAKGRAAGLRGVGIANSMQVDVANMKASANMAAALQKNQASIDDVKQKALGDVHADAEEGRAKQRAKAAETLASLQQQRQALADRLDAQIAQQKKGVEMRIAALKQQVKAAGPAGAARLGPFVAASIGQIDKVSEQVEKSVDAQAKMLEQRFEAQVAQATAVMAMQGKQALAKIDADARAAKLRIAQAGQAALVAQAVAGQDARKLIDEGMLTAEDCTDKLANQWASDLARETGGTLKGVDKLAGDILDHAHLDDQVAAANQRTEDLENKDFRVLQAQATATAAEIKEKIGHFHCTTDQEGINELLRDCAGDPDKMEMVRQAYKDATGKDLDTKLGGVMDDSEIKEAKAYERGDMETANVAILEQGDPDRIEKDVDGYYEEHPKELEKFTDAVEVQTGEKASKLLEDKLGPDGAPDLVGKVTQEEKDLKDKQDTALSEAETKFRTENPDKVHETEDKMGHLATQLNAALGSTLHVGSRDDVTKLMVGEDGRALSPAEIAILKEQYALAYPPPAPGLDDQLEATLKGKDLKAAKAELSGDNVRAAEARVEQAADGCGTNLEEWQKAMESLKTPEERARFREVIEKHTGRTYDEINKSENSGFDRDKMRAEGIVDQDQHDSGIATADYLKATQGGKVQMIEDAIGDTIGDELGESDETRNKRRQVMREATKVAETAMEATPMGGIGGVVSSVTTMVGNQNSDAALDAMASLKDKDGNIDPEKMRLFKEQVQAESGQSVDEINKEKFKGHTLDAANDLSAGNLMDAQVDRMVAGGEHVISNDRDAMSKGLEACTDPKTGKVDPEKLAAMRDKLDEKLRADGYPGGFEEWSRKNLNDDEYRRAMERYNTGEQSEETKLKLAGNTTLGIGKDTGTITDILQGKSPEQIAELDAKFRAANKGLSLKEFILSKATSVGEKRDFEILLEGNYAKMEPAALDQLAKDDPEKLIQRVKDLNQAARGGMDDNPLNPLNLTNKIGNAMAEGTSNSGKVLDERMARVEALEAKVQNHEELSDDERTQLVNDMKFMAGDKEGYVENKNKVVNATAEVAGDVTELTIDVVTEGGATQEAAVAGQLVKMTTKAALNPTRYSLDNMVSDLGQLAITVGTGPLGEAMEKVPGPIRGMVIGAVTSSASGALDTAVHGGNIGAITESALGGLGTGAFTGAIGGLEHIPGGALGQAAVQEAGNLAAGDWNQSAFDMTKGAVVDLAKGYAGALGANHPQEESPAAHGSTEHEETAPAKTGREETTTHEAPAPVEAAHTEPVAETPPLVVAPPAPATVELPTKVGQAEPNAKVNPPEAPVVEPKATEPVAEAKAAEPVEEAKATEPVAEAKASEPAAEAKATETEPEAEAKHTEEAKPTEEAKNVDEPPKPADEASEKAATAEAEEEKSSRFGEPVDYQGRQTIAYDDADGRVTGRLKDGEVMLKFPPGMPVEKRLALAEEALRSFKASAADREAMLGSIRSSTGNGGGEAPDQVVFKTASELAVASPERAAELARKQWDLDVVADPTKADRELTPTELRLKTLGENLGKEGIQRDLSILNGKCSDMTTDWQRQFAAEGEYVPIMSAKAADHRWMLAQGELILDPSIGQMFKQDASQNLRDDVPGAKHQFEPFVGTYDQLVDRVQHSLDNDYFRFGKKGQDARAVIEEVWGIRPPKDGNRITVNEDVEPWSKQPIEQTKGVSLPERDDRDVPAAELSVRPGTDPAAAMAALERPPEAATPQPEGGGPAAPAPQAEAEAADSTHPLVKKIVDDPSSPEHLAELDQAKRAVQAENEARGAAKAQELAKPGDTTVKTLILGGGVQGSLDAATLPAETRAQAMGVAMGPDPWSTYDHARVGQTGHQLLPHQPGDPTTAKPGLRGMAVEPAALSSDPQHEYLRSSELALATAETQRQSGVPFVQGRPVGPIEVFDPTNPACADWPEGAKAKVQIKTEVPDPDHPGQMKEHTETVYTTETLDVAVGPGPSRKLAEDQILDRRPLESWTQDEAGNPVSPKVQYAEEFLGTPKAAEGQDVLVYGGGDTAAWCAEAAKQQGAEGVEWAARGGKPATEEPIDRNDPTSGKRKTEFGEIEDQIKACVKADPPLPVPDELRQKYKEAMAAHARKTEEEIGKLQQQIDEMKADPHTDPQKLAAAEESLGRKKTELEPHSVAKDRNKSTNADDAIGHKTGEVLAVRPAPDGSGKVVVTMIASDGEIVTRTVDKLVCAMGQDSNAETGPVRLCDKIDKFRVIWDANGQPVGIESEPAGVRVLGASAWALQKKLAPEEQRKYADAIRRRSLVEVSKDSRGVDIGFENMGDNPARANEMFDRWKTDRAVIDARGDDEEARVAENIAKESDGAELATTPAPPTPEPEADDPSLALWHEIMGDDEDEHDQ